MTLRRALATLMVLGLFACNSPSKQLSPGPASKQREAPSKAPTDKPSNTPEVKPPLVEPAVLPLGGERTRAMPVKKIEKLLPPVDFAPALTLADATADQLDARYALAS